MLLLLARQPDPAQCLLLFPSVTRPVFSNHCSCSAEVRGLLHALIFCQQQAAPSFAIKACAYQTSTASRLCQCSCCRTQAPCRETVFRYQYPHAKMFTNSLKLVKFSPKLTVVTCWYRKITSINLMDIRHSLSGVNRKAN